MWQMTSAIVSQFICCKSGKEYCLWSCVDPSYELVKIVIVDENRLWSLQDPITNSTKRQNRKNSWSDYLSALLQAVQNSSTLPSDKFEHSFDLNTLEYVIKEDIVGTSSKAILIKAQFVENCEEYNFKSILLALHSGMVQQAQKITDLISTNMESDLTIHQLNDQIAEARAHKDGILDNVLRKMVLIINSKQREIRQLRGIPDNEQHDKSQESDVEGSCYDSGAERNKHDMPDNGHRGDHDPDHYYDNDNDESCSDMDPGDVLDQLSNQRKKPAKSTRSKASTAAAAPAKRRTGAAAQGKAAKKKPVSTVLLKGRDTQEVDGKELESHLLNTVSQLSSSSSSNAAPSHEQHSVHVISSLSTNDSLTGSASASLNEFVAQAPPKAVKKSAKQRILESSDEDDAANFL